MEWFQNLPKSIAFVDVETTGLNAHDRIVSLGAFWVATESLRDRPFPVSFVHLIFNPGRPSHPQAAKVHGHSDWALSHQEPFHTYADAVHAFLTDADLIVAHNAAFDIGFINSELERSGFAPLNRPSFCTMEECRRVGRPARLDLVCKEIGWERATRTHGALEDAWLAMMVFLSLHNSPDTFPFSEAGRFLEPFNFKKAPPPPTAAILTHNTGTPSSNTGRSLASTTAEATRIDQLVEQIKSLKRQGTLDRAEQLLLAELDRQEASAATTGFGVAPWYYEQLAIIYAKQHRYRDEISVLERYAQQPKAPGVMPAQLLTRLDRARRKYGGRS